jgi:hypothetical protein
MGRRVSRLDGRRTHCGFKCCVADAARDAERLWVKSVVLTIGRSFPDYHDQRTSSDHPTLRIRGRAGLVVELIAPVRARDPDATKH